MTDAIFFSDLRKIYTSFRDSPLTPKMLQHKVQFDIRFFFSKSRGDTGSEHMHAMTKDYFQKIMCNGEKIIVKSSELEKNNGIFQKEIYSGFIPEVPGWELCPVRSFEFYLTVLHPGCDSLWQRPRNDRPRFESEHWYVCFASESGRLKKIDFQWAYLEEIFFSSFPDFELLIHSLLIFRYCNQSAGVNNLQVFMSTLCKERHLSQVYTNHDIRLTATPFLCRAGFNFQQFLASTPIRKDSISALANFHIIIGTTSTGKINILEPTCAYGHGLICILFCLSVWKSPWEFVHQFIHL